MTTRADALHAQARALRAQADAIDAEASAVESVDVPRLPVVADEPVFQSVKNYAARAALSERTVWKLIVQGLPVVGSKKSRRIPVKDADAWLRDLGKQRVGDLRDKEAIRAGRRLAERAQ